jgi:hypothetical protein
MGFYWIKILKTCVNFASESAIYTSVGCSYSAPITVQYNGDITFCFHITNSTDYTRTTYNGSITWIWTDVFLKILIVILIVIMGIIVE